MSTTAPDLWSSISTGWADAAQQWLDQSQTMWDQVIASYPGARASAEPGDRHGHQRHHAHDRHHHSHPGHHSYTHDRSHDGCHDHDDCHCHDCHCHDTCHGHDACDCCVPDADIVLHTRIGERRVVPLRLRNPWRREREVTLGIGRWHVCGNSDLVVVAVLDTEKVLLRPCEDRVVRLLVTATVSVDNGQDNGGGDDNGGDDTTHPAHNDWTIQRDLEGCASAYADVRFEGCARPQRVAVVVSPARCEPFDVPCDCGCCC